MIEELISNKSFNCRICNWTFESESERESGDKFHSEQTPEKQKVAYRRLINECNESISQLTANGPRVLALQDLTKRAERAGLNIDISANFSPDDKVDKYKPTHINRTKIEK